MSTSTVQDVDERARGTEPERRLPAGGHPGRRRWREALSGYTFLAPNLLLLGVFMFVPLVWAFVLSLQETDGFGSGTFTGLDNYQRLLTDAAFWRSLLNTVLFTVIVVPVAMIAGLACAVLMNSVLPARGLFRTAVILPMAISGVATALIGVLTFDQNTGIANKLITAVGLPAVSWQSGGTAAFASVVLVTLWWRIGFNMIIYLAALQGISGELYESARLDGAGAFARFRFITVPMVGPATFFLLVMNVIYSFQVFDIVFVLTGGGPGRATSVLVTYAYENAFRTREQGYAAAIGMVLLLLMLVLTALQWRFGRNKDLVE